MNRIIALMATVVFVFAGCGDGGTPKHATSPSKPATDLPPALFLSAAPDGAKDVAEVKKSAKENDEVVIRGRVGGAVDVFSKARATMLIASTTMKACNVNPDDKCPTPWDYCCEPDLAPFTATIQVLDKDGALLKQTLEGASGLKPLDMVVVKGKVDKREDAKVLVINASGIYLDKSAK